MKRIFNTKIWTIVCCLFLVLSCVKDRNFDTPESDRVSGVVANTTYAEVKKLYQDETIQIQDDLVIEGYVISSDEAGNFFSVLHFQDSPTNPTEGFQIEIDLRDSHLFYPEGSKIFIKLKGLYLGKSKEVFKIGGVFTSFGNISVGRLPTTVVNDHILLSSDEKAIVQPRQLSLENISENFTNTLVQFNAIEITEEELGEPFALEREETERMLIDCIGNEIILLNSGFSDFQTELLPEESGTITGVLLRERDTYQLAIRTLEDINFSNERCEAIIDTFTSNQLFISELADPNNNAGARFVELYNSSDEPISLEGWRLVRYTNENTEVSSTIDLSGFTILAKSTFVISPNVTVFENVYGFSPDLGVGTNSPADSNGDDNILLIDPFDTIIDVFGVVGEDGSETNHEFEDGRAVRNIKTETANVIYTISEWRICNDTGAEGTTEQAKNAPEDFTPGIRN